MINYKLSPKALVMIAGSSKGTQDKYYDNGYWYKVNTKGYESLAEYISTKILECSNVTDFVKYEKCTINNKPGCRSKNFLNVNESFISFQRLFDMYHGGDLMGIITPMDSADERVNYVKDFIYSSTNLDVSNYLSKIIALDMLILNTDRHFNNLGIIINSETEECREAPIFDNGAALLSDFSKFDIEDSLEHNIEKAYAVPFSSNFELQTRACGLSLELDYSMLNNVLDELPDSRARDVLEYQLDRYEEIIPNFNKEINHDIDYDEEYEEDGFEPDDDD